MQYTRLATELLSVPLPSSIPLPSNAQVLLENLFAHAVTEPRPDCIKLLNRLLSGGCRGVIASLSTGTLQRFEEQTLILLRDKSTSEQQSTSLSCLSILAELIGSKCSKSGLRKSLARAQTFFLGTKALKTIQLAVLQVLSSCSGTTNGDHRLAIEDTKAALQVLHAVPKDIVMQWCTSNTSAMRKLFEKSIQPTMNKGSCLCVSKEGSRLPFQVLMIAAHSTYRRSGANTVHARSIS